MSVKNYFIFAFLLVLVLLGTIAVYWQGLSGPFLLDDYINIVDAYVNDFTRDEMVYALTHNNSGELGRPVSVLSLMFSGIVHGLDPWGYKYHNLAIHLINGLLIFWLLKNVLKKLATQLNEESVLLIAGMTASIWLLHPLLVSTVLYSVQRMAQLSTLFTLVALLVFFTLRENAAELSVSKFFSLSYIVFPAALLAAVFSKENGALIPFYVLAIEWLIFGFAFRNSIERKRIIIFLTIFSLVPILLGAVYTLTHFDQISDYSQRTFTLAERLLTQLHVLVIYVKMILLPKLSDMTLFHDYINVTQRLDTLTFFLLCVFVAAIFSIYYFRKRAPVVSFGIAWFVISHLMESSIFSLELMFEHRNYLAAVGLLLIPVYYCCSNVNYPQLKYVCGVFLLLVIALTLGRVEEWRSRELIYEIAIAEHPDSYRAQTSLANIRFNAGNYDAAFEHLDIAQTLNKKDFGAYIHEMIFRCGRGLDVDEIMQDVLVRASNYPVSVYSLNALDNLLSIINQGVCPEIKIEHLFQIVQAAKSQIDNQNNDQFYGFIEKVEGQAYLVSGDYGQGIKLILSAYQHTGIVRILVRLADNLIELNLLGDAEVLIKDIEKINEESFGSENIYLKPLQEKLLQAQLRIQSNNNQTEE